MKKRVFKRKKLGMALVFTLMVSVVVLAIASTYLGMVGSSAKAARSYSKEALALSLAQTGLNATLNAMGVSSNWDSSLIINKFGNLTNGGLFIASSDGMIVSSNNRMQVFADPSVRRWFYNGTGNYNNYFLSSDNSNVDEADVLRFSSFYRTGLINLRDGNIDKNAYLLIGVVPENNRSSNINTIYNLSKNNINYSVGVAALIFDKEFVPASFDRTVANLNHVVASRVLKYRVSSVFPGSIYQNMASADFPGTNHANESYFGYPNWADNTANAAFMDENTEWDGEVRIDGASTIGGRYGAPRENANGNFSTGNRDTAGVLRISLLDKSNNTKVISGNASNINSISDDELPLIGKKAFSRKNISYYDMVNNNETNINGNLLNKVCPKGSKENDDSLDINTIWQRRDANGNITSSLLSGVNDDGSAMEGLYRQMKKSSNQEHGYFKFGIDKYQPDPMYANETMQVPTIRVTINPANDNSPNDTYTIERVGYVRDNNTASGWKEECKTITTVNNADTNGMLYFEGANIQVKGKASQSISIVSDVNPEVESENYRTENAGKTINGHLVSAPANSRFNRNLTYPNVKDNTGKYKYVDPQLNESTGMWEANSFITNTAAANSMISTVDMNNVNNYTTVNSTTEANFKLAKDETDNYIFPTYGDDQQPSGNITIIGDLEVKGGTNPSVGIIAKNRVLLNDMGHSTPNTPKTKAQVQNVAPANNDGVLTVNAIVASESHNMCFDFNNMSKNLNYSNSANGKNFVNNNKTKAPGNNVENVKYAGTGSTDAAREQDREHTNYGMLMDKNLAIQLGLYNEGTNQTVTNNASRPNYVGEEIYHSDDNSKVYIYFNKYRNLPDNAKQMIWSDTYMGAIRPSNTNGFVGSPLFYSNGTLNFTGMIISRFGDINADAGVRDNTTGGRKDQLGYVNQFISFDTNLQDNAAPWFSMTSQRYDKYPKGNFIKWNILSYVDMGSLNWSKNNN